LRAWVGDIEPYDELDEVWVQIRGIPPRWSDWKTFNQIASSLSRMIEVDWNSLFTRFSNMVRVKIVCKDATKVPSKRLFEMEKKMYLIHFKVEKAFAEEGEGDGGMMTTMISLLMMTSVWRR
jgi:NurA-like 5'-3' nuclease